MPWVSAPTPYTVYYNNKILQMPRSVLPEPPSIVNMALWSRLIDLVTDWKNGPPSKPWTDWAISDSQFRDYKSLVENWINSTVATVNVGSTAQPVYVPPLNPVAQTTQIQQISADIRDTNVGAEFGLWIKSYWWIFLIAVIAVVAIFIIRRFV